MALKQQKKASISEGTHWSGQQKYLTSNLAKHDTHFLYFTSSQASLGSTSSCCPWSRMLNSKLTASELQLKEQK